MATTLFDFKMLSIDGTETDLSVFGGKKILVVNTASECGLTPQYELLEFLHKNYGDKIHVLGFPSNDFGGQEPGSEEAIKNFCSRNYGVTFPLFAKIRVKGPDAHPLFQWLMKQSGKEPNWNFAKYLLNEKGEMIKFISPQVSPIDEEVLGELG